MTEAPTPTAVLVDYLRATSPGDTVSWEDMESAIGKPPKMYWKGARRALAKDGVCFSVVDGVGLKRTSRRMINRAVKVELDTRAMSKRKLHELYQNAGFQRFVYNWTLQQHKENDWPIGGKAGADERRAAVERKKRGVDTKLPKKLSSAEVSARWTRYARETEGLEWTRDRIGSVARFAIAAVDDAYKHALRRCRSGERAGWPRFHGRGSPRQFTLQDQSFRWTHNAIKIGKLGMIPIRRQRVTERSSHQHQLDVLDGARILRLALEEKAGRWWCAIMYEREDTDLRPAGTGKAAGIDLGYAITVSDGTDSPPVYEPPRALACHLLWLKHWGRAMSRRWTKGKKVSEQSARWHRAKRVVAELHLRVAHIRKNWIEQVSHDITARYDAIVVETFDVRKMVSEKVGTRRGRRDILDIGWGMLRSAIQRKAEARGKICEDRGKLAPTDQTCSRCGARNERTDGTFRCPSNACGHTATRPRNTADLLYRIATGDPPEGFPGESQGSPAGEAGANTRGASQERSSGRRGSENGHAQRRTRGRGDKSAPTTSTKKARKTGGALHKTPRARAQHANTEDRAPGVG